MCFSTFMNRKKKTKRIRLPFEKHLWDSYLIIFPSRPKQFFYSHQNCSTISGSSNLNLNLYHICYDYIFSLYISSFTSKQILYIIFSSYGCTIFTLILLLFLSSIFPQRFILLTT